MTKRMIAAAALLLLLFGGIFGWSAMKAYFTGQYFANFSPPPVTVSAREASLETWQPRIPAVGNLAAVNGVTISAEVAGRVEKIAFKSGTSVQQGDLLVQMDDSSEQAEIPGLRARVKLARQNLARAEQLAKQGLASAEQLDAAQSEYDQARSALAAREAIINKKRIVAPFAGELGIRKIDVGEYLQPGQEIVSLQSLDELYIDFTLPEQYIGRIRSGLPVEISTSAIPGERIGGQITAVSSDIDPNSHNFAVQATIPNPGHLLKPGLFANVSIEVGEPNERVTVPRTAISYTLYGDSVYVVKEDEGDTLKAEQRFVTLGEARDGNVAILEGVEAGEKVVTAGQLKLNDGATVNIDNSIELD